jgi:serine/threonine protein kinase
MYEGQVSEEEEYVVLDAASDEDEDGTTSDDMMMGHEHDNGKIRTNGHENENENDDCMEEDTNMNSTASVGHVHVNAHGHGHLAPVQQVHYHGQHPVHGHHSHYPVQAQQPPPQQQQTQTQQQPPPQQQQQQQQSNREVTVDNEPILNGYERTNRIGQGAYGIVFRGVQRSTGNTVAIKKIPYQESTPEGGIPVNILREISLLRELDHPNVVSLLDIITTTPGHLYLIFEFIQYDLKTFMDNRQVPNQDRVGLPPQLVKSFMRQILDGVAFCHTSRVLHRDLKPHNLLISADGTQLKLADFGLARLSGLPNGPYTYEVVTLWYRAPEILLGATRYSSAVDVWSIGCIFAEMVTGLPIFPGKSDIDQLFKIFQKRGTPNADIWPAGTTLPYFNHNFPQWRPQNISNYVRMTDNDSLESQYALDLLNQILQYDPDSRLVCRTALQHHYFH